MDNPETPAHKTQTRQNKTQKAKKTSNTNPLKSGSELRCL